jgi:putative phosphoesterase
MDSQKLLVLSDTHGDIRCLKAVLGWAKDMAEGGAIGAAVFLGDGVVDLRPAAIEAEFFCEWKLVRGNNDFEFSIPDSAVLDFGGRRFFLCHGHRYALHNGYYALITAARTAEAGAALFGHTHVPCCKSSGGILLINPGSIGRPRSRAGASFAVIECPPEGEPLKTEFWGIGPQGKIFKIEV